MKPTTEPLITAMRDMYVPAGRNRGQIQFIGPCLFSRFIFAMDYPDENKKCVSATDEGDSSFSRFSLEEFAALLDDNSWYARFAGVDYDSGDFGPVAQSGMNTDEESSVRGVPRG